MNKKIEYNTVKCHPNLLEEKLNENGAFGWEFVVMCIEQHQVQKPFEVIGKPTEIATVYVLIFKREKICQD